MALHRRRLLKGALAAPMLLIKGREADAWTHGSAAPPALAAAFSFNSRIFNEPFTSLSTIDTANTLGGNFNWYVSAYSPYLGNAVTQPNSNVYSIGASGLTIASNSNNPSGFELCGRGYTGVTPPRTVGLQQLYQGSSGFYVKVVAAFNPANSPSTSLWPGVWMQDITGSLAQVDNVAPGAHFGEVDFFEALAGASGGTIKLGMAVHDWFSQSSNNFNSSNNFVSIGSPDFTQLHSYEMALVPMSKNGGTGLVRRAFDGVMPPGSDVTWTAGALFSPTEAGQYILFAFTGISFPLTIRSIEVWA